MAGQFRVALLNPVTRALAISDEADVKLMGHQASAAEEKACGLPIGFSASVG